MLSLEILVCITLNYKLKYKLLESSLKGLYSVKGQFEFMFI